MATIHVIDPLPGSRAGLVAWLGSGQHTVIEGIPVQGTDENAVAVVAVHGPPSLAEIARLARAAPGLPVVAVLPEVDALGFVAALCAGAAGILTWDTDPDTFARIIDAALAGLAMLPSSFVRQLAVGQPTKEPRLTAQERHWLRELANGAVVADLAVAAGYSERSMYRLLRHTYQALGVNTRSLAIVEALNLGLL